MKKELSFPVLFGVFLYAATDGSAPSQSSHDSLLPRYLSLAAARDTCAASHTLMTSGHFRSSSKIEPAIDTHSYRHTPTV